MMMKKLILTLAVLVAAPFAAADDIDEFQRLEKVIRQDIICLDLLPDNVGEGQRKGATRQLYSALVSNIRTYIDVGIHMGLPDLVAVRDYVGSDEILVGVFLGAMLSDDAELQREKDAMPQGQPDQETSRLLWSRYDCAATNANL
ncbi:MAG: hypothetical protein R3E46_12935 [Sedimenticolaceae bacterium]|nr:hypothetical protein [Gammaproteobacteria bacterium]